MTDPTKPEVKEADHPKPPAPATARAEKATTPPAAAKQLPRIEDLRFEVLHTMVSGHPQGSVVSLDQLGIAPRAGSSITPADTERYLKRLLDEGAVREADAPTETT